MKNFEVAQRLSARNNLPGAVIDQMLQQQFESLYSSRNFEGCAQLSLQAEKMRTGATIQRLKSAPPEAGKPPPVMIYFQTLINAGKLNSVESVALIKELLPLGQVGPWLAAISDRNFCLADRSAAWPVAMCLQIAFVEQKLAEDKIACTEEVGDMIKTAANNPKLAMQIYLKGKSSSPGHASMLFSCCGSPLVHVRHVLTASGLC